MNWNKVNAGTNIRFFEQMDKPGAIDLQPIEVKSNGIKMVDVIAIGIPDWSLNDVEISEGFVVHLRVLLPRPDEVIQATQLMNAEGCRNVRHVVLVTRGNDFVEPRAGVCISLPCIPAHTVQGKTAHFFGQVIIVSRDHPTFAGGDILVGVEREGCG